MTAAAFPPVSALTPQSGPMQLLCEVLEHTPGHTVCSVDPARSGLLADADGRVPAWVGIEYLAQCAAVHGGLRARAQGDPPRPGLLLGSRRLGFAASHFEAGQPLQVRVEHHRGERGLVAFDGEVRDAASGAVLVHGRIHVFLLASWEELSAGVGHGA